MGFDKKKDEKASFYCTISKDCPIKVIRLSNNLKMLFIESYFNILIPYNFYHEVIT